MSGYVAVTYSGRNKRKEVPEAWQKKDIATESSMLLHSCKDCIRSFIVLSVQENHGGQASDTFGNFV